MSQSLAEDDSVAAHSIKSGKSTGMFLSSSESAFSSTSTAVTPERKQVLLAQARADRLDWIRQVPLPYKCETKGPVTEISDKPDHNDVWQKDPRLAELNSTFVFQQSQSTVQVLSHLYGIGRTVEVSETSHNNDVESVSKRVAAIMDQVNEDDGDEDGKVAVPTAEQIRNTALAEEEGDPVLRGFSRWASSLSDPAAAVLVQGMRGFCKKIRKESSESLPPKLQGYLRLTFESLKDYAPWKESEVSEETTRRSLESFIYGHLENYLDGLYWTDEAKEQERDWQNRLGSLQFVNPKHLEIHCLDDTEQDYKEIFRKPVEALLSVEKYFSPFEKLQRILAIYHNVNAALSDALNRSNESTTKKLPSADDVLPSIILIVLIARPARLLLNLQLIEDLSPQEYLRGEAGYAYTNLYGAVQFLKDIDLDADKPDSLNMEPEEFRNSLKACREATEAKLAQRRTSAVNLESTQAQSTSLSLEETFIPVAEIREARMRGEVVDVEWATRRLSENHVERLSSEENGGTRENGMKDDADDLPSGFSRSYTFLSSRPEDIKLSDLPKLLAEYKMLVHTTESLIGEKIAKANAEKKAKLKKKQAEVYEAAKEVDPSLLPSKNSSSKRK